MNNKTTAIIVSVVVGIMLVGGGVFAYTSNQNDKAEQDKMAMEKKAEDEAMMKKDDSAAMEAEKMEKDGEAMEGGDVMVKHGSYVTLADYNNDSSKFADSKKVYFFHASWCPICKSIDEEITSDTTKIPAGVTMIKTDFDSSTELRQKYGVTTQYTFVQVDASGNETSQWSATNLQKAIDGIEI